jgi:hypothetical protein
MNPSMEQQIAGPGRHETNLTSVDPWMIDGETVGVVASYVFKDVRRDRAADYWEFYDHDGDLLAISWFDQFGIRRIAIDEGIVQHEGILAGVFVLVVNGQSF